MIPALDEHQLLVFWSQLLLLVGFARLLGYLMRRVGLPSVVGELGAGILLGPTVFGRVWESGFESLFPPEELQGGLIVAVGWVGILLLLIVTGFETDLTLIGRLGRASTLVSTLSIIVPLAAGLVVGVVLPDTFLGPEATRLSFTLFIGLALAVSSLAVVAKILSELGFMRRDFGQITVAAGMANDVVRLAGPRRHLRARRVGSIRPRRVRADAGGHGAVHPCGLHPGPAGRGRVAAPHPPPR